MSTPIQDFHNYSNPTPLKGGLLNKGILRWTRMIAGGPQYIVTKKVCWQNPDTESSRYLVDLQGGKLTKGNVLSEKEMLLWAQEAGLGPKLYTSKALSSSNCMIFAIQYFDCTAQDLNQELQRREWTYDAIFDLYRKLLASAEMMTRKLNDAIARGTIIIDIKPDNVAIDLTSTEVRVLDWGAADPGNRDCFGRIVYDVIVRQLQNLPSVIPLPDTNTKNKYTTLLNQAYSTLNFFKKQEENRLGSLNCSPKVYATI